MHFLTSWKVLLAKPKLIVRQLAQVILSLVLVILEHIEHILSLLKLVLHLLSLDVLTSNHRPLELEVLLLHVDVFLVRLVDVALLHNLLSFQVQFLLDLKEIRLFSSKVFLLLLKSSNKALSFLPV